MSLPSEPKFSTVGRTPPCPRTGSLCPLADICWAPKPAAGLADHGPFRNGSRWAVRPALQSVRSMRAARPTCVCHGTTDEQPAPGPGGPAMAFVCSFQTLEAEADFQTSYAKAQHTKQTV